MRIIREIHPNLLEENDFFYAYGQHINGIAVGHRPCEMMAVEVVANHFDVRAVLETGTLYGGVTSVLTMFTEGNLISFDHEDKRDTRTKKLMEAFGAEFVCMDIFTREPEFLGLVKTFTEKFANVPIMFYLDNGNKLTEIIKLAPFMKDGDVMMVHDCNFEWNLDQLPPDIEVAPTLQPMLKNLKSWQMVFTPKTSLQEN